MALVKVKDPDAVLNYTFDWDDEYLGAGVTVSTSDWVVSPTGTLTIDSESETTTQTTVALSAGTVGQVYRVTNTVVLSNGETEERSLTVRVDER
jgi:predicted hotdog family 3-hydroxylacyl-ACP dehydratase